MEAITSQISALYEQANEEGRHKIQNTLRDLQHSLDTDFELSLRIGSGPLQMSLITIGVDLQLFTHLASSPSPITLYDLVKKTSAAPKILSHLLRAMASFGLISETAANTYTSTRTTRLLANDNVAGALTHIWQLHVPTINAFPSYLQDRKYQDLTSNTDLPFQVAMKTDLAPFDWMKQHPEHLKSLAHAGAIQREGSWFENYALLNSETKAIKADDEAVLLVDIGGAFGHQALAFKKHFLDLQKRIAVQDMQESISQAPKDDGVEKYVHDFFTEQPIKGAKYYYLRHILHDWSDEDCVRILQSIVPAMGPESRIVIDEVVLPDEGLSWQAAYMDLTMMTCIGGNERTKSEYGSLLEAAGLKFLDVHKYGLSSVVLAVPK